MKIGYPVFNIYNFKINNITGNGSVNIGMSRNSEFSFNSTDQGSQISIGDSSPATTNITNKITELQQQESKDEKKK